MGRPRNSKNIHYPVGWSLRDIEVTGDLGLTQIGDHDKRTGRKRNVRTLMVRHTPCGATRVVPSPWLGAWARQQVGRETMSRIRAWCKCDPKPGPRGYVRAKNSRDSQHRQVMSRIIGRKLFPGENVHHINGIKSDNRPGNLELWVSSQPAGQRPDDIIAHAVDMLQRYAPGLLSPYPVDRLLGIRRLG